MEVSKQDKRIAVLGRGAHGMPSYRVLLNALSQHFDITVYSEVHLPSENLPKEAYSIRSVPAGNYPRRIRELFFLFMVFRDHIKSPYFFVHAHSTYPSGLTAIILQKFFKVPAIVCLDGAEGSVIPKIKFGDLLHWKRSKVNKWVINQAKFVTTLTSFQKEEVCKNLGIKRDIRVIPRGVDRRRFRSSHKDFTDSSIVFLSVGYLNLIKDPEMLLNTFFLIQQKCDCKLIHVGRDYMDGSIQKMAYDLGISEKISFEGYKDYSSIPEYFYKADILLHTSVFESQAMVVAEALTSGVLVCGTHVGLMGDLADSCCLTVEPGNYKALAEKVLHLLADPGQMKKLRENGMKWGEQHDLEWTKNQYMKIYNSF